jgi:hypothetical protein
MENSVDASVLLKRSNTKLENTQTEAKAGVMRGAHTDDYRLLSAMPGPVAGWSLRAAVALFESPIGKNLFNSYRGWNSGLASIGVSCTVTVTAKQLPQYSFQTYLGLQTDSVLLITGRSV